MCAQRYQAPEVALRVETRAQYSQDVFSLGAVLFDVLTVCTHTYTHTHVHTLIHTHTQPPTHSHPQTTEYHPSEAVRKMTESGREEVCVCVCVLREGGYSFRFVGFA